MDDGSVSRYSVELILISSYANLNSDTLNTKTDFKVFSMGHPAITRDTPRVEPHSKGRQAEALQGATSRPAPTPRQTKTPKKTKKSLLKFKI